MRLHSHPCRHDAWGTSGEFATDGEQLQAERGCIVHGVATESRKDPVEWR